MSRQLIGCEPRSPSPLDRYHGHPQPSGPQPLAPSPEASSNDPDTLRSRWIGCSSPMQLSHELGGRNTAEYVCMTDDSQVVGTLAEVYHIRGYSPGFERGFRQDLTYVVPSAKAGLPKINPQGPDPREYVEFAKDDLARGGASGAINALSNAKRAVHLSIERLLQLHCLNRYATKAGFPGLLRLFDELEAFPTRMVASLNKRRNVVEHEYASVGEDEARDFVEISDLFVRLCYRYFRSAVVGVYVGRVTSEACHEWRLNPIAYAVDVFDVQAATKVMTQHGPVHYNISRNTPRRLIEQIPITLARKSDWVPIVALWLYCTNEAAYRLKQLGTPGQIIPTICEYELRTEQDAQGRSLVHMTETTYAPPVAARPGYSPPNSA